MRDIQRIAAARGIPFSMPEPFPQNGLMAARLSLVGLESTGVDHGWGARFITEVFRAQFASGWSISDTSVIGACLRSVSAPVDNTVARSTSAEIKSRLRSHTEAAQVHGIFGAPTLRTRDGELFWGDDRLDQAVAWAQQL